MSAGRSLRASQDGIQRAKRALKRENLTQKALSSEMAIASWSTISKFFNGKPVDRPIFLEICTILDLDWSDIALRELPEKDEDAIASDSTPSASEEPNPLLATVKRNSDRARAALNPYILPRITRAEPLEKCLKAIGRGTNRMRRVVPILGAAGYGKSTLLGSIYDALTVPVDSAGERAKHLDGLDSVSPTIDRSNTSSTGERAKHLDSSDSVSPTIDRSNACAPTASPALPPWVVLVRCNDLIESAETFALELGEKASGERESIVEIAARLTRDCGAGVLLVDTLDIVLERRLVPIFRNLILELLELGTTVAFTCRDRDYQDFFEPYHESFAGFVPNIERQTIAEFTEAEVREAAAAFVGARGDLLAGDSLEASVTDTQAAAEFADKIIALSANSQSIAEITRNPLLLALLCDLFAKEENVPEDLTVGQLYDTYWNLRVARGYKSQGDSRRVGMAKKNLCLEVACRMYRNSTDRLRDFVWETQLQLDDAQLLAYGELKSDGVLAEIGGERIAFFHQTFLEYAIARWLQSTPEGEGAKTELFEALNQPEAAYVKHYLWSVVRQLLNLVEVGEFHHLCRGFDWHEMLPFRTVALTAVAHSSPEASSILLQLLPLALQEGTAYQDTLVRAIQSASARHGDNAWTVLVELLQHVDASVGNRVAQIAGELLVRLKTRTGERVEQALEAVGRRPEDRGKKSRGQFHTTRSHIFGKLIGAYAQAPKIFGQSFDIDVCRALSTQYFRLGSQTRSIAIELHLSTGVPESARRQLLETIISDRIHEQAKEKEAAIALLDLLLPDLWRSGDSIFGCNWLDTLYADLPQDWDRVQAAVVGKAAIRERTLRVALVEELLQRDVCADDRDRLRRTQMALVESIASGGGGQIAELLLAAPAIDLPLNRRSSVFKLVRELALQQSKLDMGTREALARWILPLVDESPKLALGALNALAVETPVVEALFAEVLEKTIPQLDKSQVNSLLKGLSRIPPSIEPYLIARVDRKECRLALVKLYSDRVQISGSKSAIDRLLDLCLDASREVALKASSSLSIASEEYPISTDGLIRVAADARILGVRHNALNAFRKILDRDADVESDRLVVLFTSLRRERVPEIVQPLYQIVQSWIEIYEDIPDGVAEIIFELTEGVIVDRAGDYLDGGVARCAFAALKRIANLNRSESSAALSRCTRKLIRTTNINRAVDRSFPIGLLERVSRLDEQLLERIVREDFFGEEGEIPVANQCAVVVAIAFSQGKDSPLLDEILQGDRFSPQVKNCVIRERDG
ncbi:MAG: hypothetical protein SWY16_21675 [Cyanobacteriota bacterium]|nr:hypothetical protein [Cyanobacteriota bacterium]